MILQVANKPKHYCFIGDGHIKKSIYNQEVFKQGISGLPINDISVKRMFQKAKDFDVIFFSCGYFLMGCQEIEAIKTLQEKNINQRFIPYHTKPKNRGFYNQDFWKGLNYEEVDFLFQNWKEMINYFYQEHSNIIFLPLATHYYDKILNLSNKGMNFLKQFNRVVDLSPLNNASEDDYIDKFGNLSELSWASIESNVLSYLI